MPTSLKRILRGLLLFFVILPLTGALYQIVATEIDRRSYPPPGRLVDVGGYRLHLYCMGENTNGRPTVILETGLGGLYVTSSAWAWVQPEIAKTTRVCSYDRAGLGWSDPSPLPRDAQHIVAELHTLLHNSHTPGPFVLVGWSFGGLYMRAYANQYREEVAGLVLLDSSSPDQCASSPAFQALCASNTRTVFIASVAAHIGIMRVIGLFQQVSDLPGPQSKALLASYSATKDWDAQRDEFQASPATNAQVRGSKTFGSIPLFVLTATDHEAPPVLEHLWQVWQAGYTALSTNSVQRVVPGATHTSIVISPTGSRVSVEAILQVVEAVNLAQR